MTRLMDVVLACENQLGWSGPAGMPLWQARAGGFSRLQAALSRTDPQPSIEDLHLAIAWCQRRRQAITSPAQLIGYVAEAKVVAATPENPSSLAVAIHDAIATERQRDDTSSLDWISRLTRAQGPFRADTLTEWKAADRG